MTNVDDFAEHLGRVRARFASTLADKIADGFIALEKISGGGGETIEIVVTAHRRLHEICGIAPTLGFEATGKAAALAEAVIRGAAKSKRALVPAEIAAFASELEGLRAAAAGELQTYSNRG